MAEKKNGTLMGRIAAASDTFTPKRSSLAKYIVDNYRRLAYCTLTEMAHDSGVSETTILRFVASIGYSGFPDFMVALRKEIEKNAPAAPSMDLFDLKQKNYRFPEDACRAIFTLEIEVIKDMLNKIDMSRHEQAVDLLYRAESVAIIGCGANSCCTHALAYALQIMRPNVKVIEKADITDGNAIQDLPKNSVCVAFSTPRYPKNTQFLLEKIKEQGNSKIIGFSDSILSPIAPLCDIFFEIPVKYITFIDSNAAFMVMIHSILFALYLKDKKKINRRIRAYDDYSKECRYYVSDSLNLIEF
ncbi:MAG: MurR/RpiR family transcriptional regulator [Synergistaceae bacterium]|nr:MurR/RpiR family transcriptional regulator [Synergistaceae bacterium]